MLQTMTPSYREIDMKTFDIGLSHDFDQVLFLRERELCALLDAREHGLAASDQHDQIDFKDLANEQSLAAVDESQAEQAALELEQVLAARRRLHDHTYGFCLDCGESIDLDRLSAMPASSYCTACQTGHERNPASAKAH